MEEEEGLHPALPVRGAVPDAVALLPPPPPPPLLAVAARVREAVPEKWPEEEEDTLGLPLVVEVGDSFAEAVEVGEAVLVALERAWVAVVRGEVEEAMEGVAVEVRVPAVLSEGETEGEAVPVEDRVKLVLPVPPLGVGWEVREAVAVATPVVAGEEVAELVGVGVSVPSWDTEGALEALAGAVARALRVEVCVALSVGRWGEGEGEGVAEAVRKGVGVGEGVSAEVAIGVTLSLPEPLPVGVYVGTALALAVMLGVAVCRGGEVVARGEGVGVVEEVGTPVPVARGEKGVPWVVEDTVALMPQESVGAGMLREGVGVLEAEGHEETLGEGEGAGLRDAVGVLASRDTVGGVESVAREEEEGVNVGLTRVAVGRGVKVGSWGEGEGESVAPAEAVPGEALVLPAPVAVAGAEETEIAGDLLEEAQGVGLGEALLDTLSLGD